MESRNAIIAPCQISSFSRNRPATLERQSEASKTQLLSYLCVAKMMSGERSFRKLYRCKNQKVVVPCNPSGYHREGWMREFAFNCLVLTLADVVLEKRGCSYCQSKYLGCPNLSKKYLQRSFSDLESGDCQHTCESGSQPPRLR